jgi:capsular polysaccharide transport system permease protein
MAGTRSSGTITYAVWRALFLREAVQRISGNRIAWLWLLLEPIIHIAFIMFLFEVVRMRTVPGADPAMYVMVGLIAFFMARTTTLRCMAAVGSNMALFAFRQIKPVDTVLVRAALEGFLLVVVLLIMLLGAGLLGFEVIANDPLLVLAALIGMWLCGVGLGLMFSVANELLPEFANVLKMVFMPLYFISGVMYPIYLVPQPYRGWLFYNPLLNGVEYMRDGFFSHYDPMPEASLAYLYAFGLIVVFFGLVLHVRFSQRLISR